MRQEENNSKGRRVSKIKILFGILFIVILILSARFVPFQKILHSILDWVASLGPWAPFIYVLIYALAPVLFVPGAILTMGAGVLFGVVKGSVVVSIGATLGAIFAFLAGRYLARDWLQKKLGHNPKFKAIDEAVGREGLKIVGLTRLSPVLPYVLLNYAFGLTKVSLRDYALATGVCMIPAVVLYVYIGSLVGDLALIGTGHRDRTLLEWVLYVVGLLATLAVSVYVTRIARKALKKEISS